LCDAVRGSFGSAATAGRSSYVHEQFQILQKIMSQISLADFTSSPKVLPQDEQMPLQVPLSPPICSSPWFFNLGTKERNRIAYVPIEECEDYTIALFVLPKYTYLPLHDHPHMTVLSKILCGQVYWRAFDWETNDATDRNPTSSFSNLFNFSRRTERRRKAKIRFAEVIEEGRMLQLGPSEGNIHAIKALKYSIMLDVLAPPYSEFDERYCTYYDEIPQDSNESNLTNGSSWLIQKPFVDFSSKIVTVNDI